MASSASIWRPIISSQGASAILTVTGIVSLVLLTRGTTVAVFGQYSVLIAAATLFMRFGGLNIYFHYRNRYPTVPADQALSILRTYLPAVTGIGVAAILVAVVANLFFGFLPASPGLDLALWVTLALFSMINLELVRYYQSTGRNIFGTWLGAIAKIAASVMLGLWLLVSPGSMILTEVLLVLILAQLVQFVAQLSLDPAFLAIRRAVPEKFDPRAIAGGIFIIPVSLFYDGLSLFDRLAVSNIISDHAAGQYGLASQGINMAYVVLGGSLITLFYPRLVRANKTSGEAVRSALKTLLLAGGGASLLGSALIYLLAPAVPLIFGHEYEPGIEIVRAMALVPFGLFMLSVLNHLSYLFGETRLSVGAFTIGTVICATLNPILVAQTGTSGAVATLYTTILTVIGMHVLIFSRRSSPVRRELFR